MSIPFLPTFLLAISIVFSAFKTPWLKSLSITNTTSVLKSFNWLPIQQRFRINFKLATLVHYSFYNAGPQYLSSLLHPYMPSCQLHSASLNLLSQPPINIALASVMLPTEASNFYRCVAQNAVQLHYCSPCSHFRC